MADFHHRLPDNVPGKFYVDDVCLDHGACEDCAPGLFKRNHDSGTYYVSKQPETAEELLQMREAIEGCPMEAIGDDGDRNDWSVATQHNQYAAAPPESPKSNRPWWKFW
jgi:ferredoxin